jgi:aryl-alcohol dehydrogenase-like predicted oxidoreductase
MFVEQKYNLGLTSWSPLFGGVLTGKYLNGIPEGSRMSNEMMKGFYMTGIEAKLPKIVALNEIAQEIGASLAQFAVAWCASNKQVSTVMIGATSIPQLQETLQSLEFVDKITPAIKERVEAIMQFQPQMHAVDRTIAAMYVKFD